MGNEVVEMEEKVLEDQNKIENGQGTYIFSDGENYVGEWKDGEENGQGTYTFSDGAKYVGEFKFGKRNGQGTYTFYDGGKYVGEFFNGKMWNGTKYDENGNFSYKLVNGNRRKQ